MSIKKPFPYQLISAGVALFVVISGYIAVFAVQGEKITRNEKSIEKIIITEEKNIEAHTMILLKLERMGTILERLDSLK